MARNFKILQVRCPNSAELMARNFKVLEVPCPYCGSCAKRLFTELTTKTECSACDYVIELTTDGKIIDIDLRLYSQ